MRKAPVAIESSEKRDSQRVPLALPVKGKCLGKLFRGHSFHGETRDVSYEGLCIKVDTINAFTVGQDIEFKTRLYPGDFLLKAKGRVCWVSALPNSDRPINMGVKITRMRHQGLWVERIEDKTMESS
jgi:hypothetical protein